MNEINKLVGQRIRRLRKRHRFSQEQLAQMIGTAQTTLSAYETGARNIDAETLWELAKALGEPINVFFPDMDSKKEAEVPKKSNTIKLLELSNEPQIAVYLNTTQILQLYEQTRKWVDEMNRLRKAMMEERDDEQEET